MTNYKLEDSKIGDRYCAEATRSRTLNILDGDTPPDTLVIGEVNEGILQGSK